MSVQRNEAPAFSRSRNQDAEGRKAKDGKGIRKACRKTLFDKQAHHETLLGAWMH